MLEIDFTRDANPSTTAEKITYYVFWALLIIFFTLEMLDNYQPVKLTVVFFVLAWMPMTFLHELGHALAARFVGWEVKEFVIGYGKILKKFEYQGIQVEFRMIPLGGYVLPDYNERNWSRLKSAFVYFAGPGMELAIFAVFYLKIGVGQFTASDGNLATIMMQGVALSAVTGGVLNLIPHLAVTQNGRVPNDGLGILLSFVGRRA